MMEVNKTHLEKLILRMELTKKQINSALTNGMAQGMILFKGKVEREQMSGRKTPSFGLNVRSGELRRSSQIRKNYTYNSAENSVTLSYRSRYARIHQFGGTIKHPGGTAYFKKATYGLVFVKNSHPLAAHLPRTRKHNITIPKRLYIYEDFKVSGIKIIKEKMIRHLLARNQRTTMPGVIQL